MDLLTQESQIYEVEDPIAMIDDTSNNNKIKHVTQVKKSKVLYPSPLWYRDCTNRLMRKQIRRSTSYDSSLNKIGNRDSLLTNDDIEANNSIFCVSEHYMDGSSTPLRHREKCSSIQLRRELIPSQDRIFHSTMKYNSLKDVSKINSWSLIENDKDNLENSPRNRTEKIRSSASSGKWTPFWSRDNSHRLSRRHYISDFF